MMRTLLLIILVVALLAISNPDKADFAEFAREQSAELMAQQTDGVLGGALGRLGGDLIGSQVGRFVGRDNYLVASVYTLDLDGPNADKQDWRFLGVAGQFVELSRPAALKR